MNKKKAGVVFIALLTCAWAGQALAQGQEIEYKSNADDLTKIRSLLEEFRQDIIHKDGYALTKLMLNPNILFHSIDNQEFHADAPIYIPVAKIRIPAAPVTCERICGST